MPFSTTPKIGLGSTLSYEDQALAGTYIECIWMIDTGDIGDESSFADASPLRSAAEVKIPGASTSQQREFKFIDVPGDVDQEAFVTLATNKVSINMRVAFSNGRQMDFIAALAEPKWSSPARDSRIEVTVPYSKSGSLTMVPTP